MRARLIPLIVHPSESFVDYRVGVETPGKYKIILNSDEKRFGGHDRVDMKGEYFTTDFPWNDRKNFLQVSCVRAGANRKPWLINALVTGLHSCPSGLGT